MWSLLEDNLQSEHYAMIKLTYLTVPKNQSPHWHGAQFKGAPPVKKKELFTANFIEKNFYLLSTRCFNMGNTS